MSFWMVTVYRSRYSRVVLGHMSIEAPDRPGVRDMLSRIAQDGGGAARECAQQALSGRHRITLVKHGKFYHGPYAAQDGYWRGWNQEAWEHNPPAAYAIWRNR